MANIKDIHGNPLSLSASDILIPSLGVSLADAIAQQLLPVPDNVTEQVEGLESKVAHAVGTISSVTVAVATDDTGTTHAEGAYQDGVLAITLYNVKGDKGDALTFEDLTDEQKAELKGEKMTFADLTEEEKNELRGAEGEGGKSAYDLAVENGFVGTVAEWLVSIRGEKGEPGTNGKDGKNGADGHVNVVNQVEPNDQTNAVTGKAVADYVGTHSGGDNIVGGNNVLIETLPNGSKRINAQLAGGTAQAASEVSYNNGDGTQTNLQDKMRSIDELLPSSSVLDGGEEEMIFSSDDNSQIFAKIGKYGMKAKGFYLLDGTPIGGGGGGVSLSFLVGKKIGAIGDSLTAGVNSPTNFIKELATMLGMTYCNKALGGNTLSQIYQQVERLDADCSIIFIMGGTNNFKANNPEGEIGELITWDNIINDSLLGTKSGTLNTTDGTIAAYLNLILIAVRQKFPKAFIILANPPKTRAGYDKSASSNPFDLLQLRDVIHDAATLHSVMFCDMSTDVQINSQILESEEIFYTYSLPAEGNNINGYDRSHPTANGCMMIASYLYDVISRNAKQISYLLNL